MLKSQRTQTEATPGQQYVSVGNVLPTIERSTLSRSPRPWKVYRGGSQVLLPPPQPAPVTSQSLGLTTQSVSNLLHDLYGLTRQSWRALAARQADNSDLHALQATDQATPVTLHRSVPSGGSCYPCEVYLSIGQAAGLAQGIYHYDAVHHALDTLRPGMYQPQIHACYTRTDSPLPELTILLSCCFWNTAYKYGAFSYRLHSLDVGVVVGQVLAIAHDYGLDATVHYRFLDLALDQLVGLDPAYESMYALVTLHVDPAAPARSPGSSASTAVDLASISAQPLEQPASLVHWPLLNALHSASLLAAEAALDQACPAAAPATSTMQLCIPLPWSAEPLNLRAGLQQRRSAQGSFTPGALTQSQLAALLATSVQAYRSDLTGASVMVFCAINRVAATTPGVYRYHAANHALELINDGAPGASLQRLLREPAYNMAGISVCMFVVGHYDRGFAVHGDRWYRMLNMEAGIVVQRLGLAAAALGLGCQTILSYHVQLADALLCLSDGWTSLAHVLIAPTSMSGYTYEHML